MGRKAKTVFEIADLHLGKGLIGICPIPGRTDDYAGDLERVLAWRPSVVFTMTTEIELECVGAERLPGDLSLAGIRWRHLPVSDIGAPSPRTAALWPQASNEARAILARGGRILAHCYRGRGRSGMVLLRLMIEAGEPAETALARLRAVQPCAVETAGQLAWAAQGAAASTALGSAAR